MGDLSNNPICVRQVLRKFDRVSLIFRFFRNGPAGLGRPRWPAGALLLGFSGGGGVDPGPVTAPVPCWRPRGWLHPGHGQAGGPAVSSWPPRAGGIPGVLRQASTYQARIAQRSGRSATGPSFSRQASTYPHQAESAAHHVRNCRCLQSSYGQTSKAGSRSPLHGHVGLTPHMN